MGRRYFRPEQIIHILLEAKINLVGRTRCEQGSQNRATTAGARSTQFLVLSAGSPAERSTNTGRACNAHSHHYTMTTDSLDTCDVG